MRLLSSTIIALMLLAPAFSQDGVVQLPATETSPAKSNAAQVEQDNLAPTALRRDMHNLMNITQAVHRYAAEHDGRMPESMGATLPYIENWTEWTEESKPRATLAEKARLYLSSGDLSRVQIPERPTAEWVTHNTSYVYLGASSSKLAAYFELGDIVIAHGRLDNGDSAARPSTRTVDVVPVVMLDAHAEVHPKGKAKDLIKKSAETITRDE